MKTTMTIMALGLLLLGIALPALAADAPTVAG